MSSDYSNAYYRNAPVADQHVYPSSNGSTHPPAPYSYASQAYSGPASSSNFPQSDARYDPAANPYPPAYPPTTYPSNTHSSMPDPSGAVVPQHVPRAAYSAYDYHPSRASTSPISPVAPTSHTYARAPYTSPASPPYTQSTYSQGYPAAYTAESEDMYAYPRDHGVQMAPSPTYSADYPNTIPRAFTCEVCPLSFHRQHDLKRHEKTHSGSKPYNCNGGCGKTFTRKDALKRHQLVKKCGTFDETLI
ncbi:hypothetical protein CYLTODRAFT_406012 [Cylindrobasidium torrendii FP15055 ss-10]|uniref:C2H2-type domain-containing protein n=1 Tax=Cylindrobasidium torrendii FP15055 ss-10 TaxID=1314674 RepID=A0A0D7BW23_9AGAR|nr:hypothetical protein CYLTODRAFT_406012 [Cylindrobasidium torrendii FP15055 ss-10]